MGGLFVTVIPDQALAASCQWHPSEDFLYSSI